MHKALIILVTGIQLGAAAQTCIGVDTECGGTNNYCFNCAGGDCGPFELSDGIYRIPYINTTEVEITNDHLNHCPRGRIDMIGTGGPSPYKIAAAADGWIRAIVDDNNIQCDCSVTSCENNYIWMEHPNGEWTKYTHMIENSVTDLGHYVGEWVTAGTYLGQEGDVGCASGEHLHFEVAQPIDTNTLVFSAVGGYIDFDWAKNVIPVICSISGNVFTDGANYTAAACGTCSSALFNYTTTYTAGDYDADFASTSISNVGSVIFDDYSSGLYQAGGYISLLEGFEAKANSDITARIGDCYDFPERLAELPNEHSNQIFIFPNPASITTTLRWNNPQSQFVNIYMFDITGRLVMVLSESKMLYEGYNQITFHVESIPDGVYIIEIQSEDLINTIRLVVSKE